MSLKSLLNQTIANKSLINSIAGGTGGGADVPVITSIVVCDSSYNELDDTALNPAGGYIKIIGTGFKSGCSVYFNSDSLTATFISSTEVRVQTPVITSGAYNLMLFNSLNQGGAIYLNLTVSNFPTWTTAAGSLGTIYETQSISTAVAATGDNPLTYSLYSGDLPSGSTLASDGTLSGTAPVESGSTTYTFVANVKDPQGQDSTRTFSLTISVDVVSWSSPASGSSYVVGADIPISSVTLSATSAAGYGVQYTANSLPTGISLNNGVISGTPTTEQTIYTQLTATANTTGRSATRMISWSVTVGDTYWKYVTLLVSGSNTSANTHIKDFSLNNNQLSPAFDVRATNFNPYNTEGYYSNYFDGTTDSITFSSNVITATGNFTMEGWYYVTSGAAMMGGYPAGGGFELYYGGTYVSINQYGSTSYNATVALPKNQWVHIAVVRDGGTWYVYQNGVAILTQAWNPTFTLGTFNIGDAGSGTELKGYVSNFRITNTIVYPSGTTFTPPTTPLTAIPGTTVLTCQSNRFIDNSSSGLTITRNGDTQIVSKNPYQRLSNTVTYNTLSSYYFNGSSTLSVPASTNYSFDADFTIEAWINVSNAASGSPQAIFGSQSGANYFDFRWFTTRFQISLNSGSGTNIGGTLQSGTWTHVALVRSGSTITLYVNGVASATTLTNSTTLGFSSTTYYIGATQSASNLFTGLISNLRVVKGTAVYTSDFTPPTESLTAISGTSLLTCRDNTIKDSSTNNVVVTTNSLVKPVAVSPFTQVTSNASLTQVGSTYFDGTGDNLTGSYLLGAYDWWTNDYTIEAWVYPTTLASGWNYTDTSVIPTLIGNASTSATNNYWSFGPISTGVVRFYYFSGSQQVVSSTATVVAGQWNHIAMSKTSSGITIYVNGVGNTPTAVSGTPQSGTAYPLSIGMKNTAGVQGYVSDIRIVKGNAIYTSNFIVPQAPLTVVANTQLLTCSTKVASNNNVFLDKSTLSTVTQTNGVLQGTYTPFNKSGWSVRFDGNADYITYPTTAGSLGTDNFTIELWAYFDSLVSASSQQCSVLFGHNANWDTAGDIIFFANFNSSLSYQAGYFTVALRNFTFSTSSSVLSANKWHHIAVVRDSTTSLKLFVDGVLKASTTSFPSTQTVGSSAGWIVGSQNNFTDRAMDGYISNLRVLKGTALYTSDFTVPMSPLTPIANTHLLVCQSPGFEDNGPNQSPFTVTGTATVQTFGPFSSYINAPTSYSTYFDGTGDYLTVASNTAFQLGTGSFTFETWIYPTNLGSSNINNIINIGTYADGIMLRGASTTGVEVYINGSQRLITSTGLIPNTWQHIALVRNGSAGAVYVNGTSIGTFTDSSNISPATATLTIGRALHNTSEYFTGYMSNYRLVKGTAVYTSNFTTPTSPLTAVSGTSLLTCQSNTFKDNSTNNFALSSFGNVRPKQFNPFGYVTSGALPYSPELNSGSMYFNGTSNYLTVTNPELNFGTGDFTVECWQYRTFTPNVSGRTYALFGMVDTALSFGVFNNMVDTGGTHAGKFGVNDSAVNSLLYGTTVTASNSWYHYCATRENGTLRLFTNGVLEASTTYTTAVDLTTSYVGWDHYNYSWDIRLFPGYISNLRVVKGEALYKSSFIPSTTPVIATSNTVLQLDGTDGPFKDAKTSNLIESFGNVVSTPESPYNGSYYSNKLDGDGDRLNVAAHATNFDFGTGNFTAEFWMYMDDIANVNSSDYHMPFATDIIFNGTGAFTFLINVNGAYDLRVFSPPTGDLIASKTVKVGRWHHVAFVRTSTTQVLMFLDGEQVAAATITAGSTYGAANSGMVIGDQNGFNDRSFNGKISNVRVVKGTALYTAPFTPPTEPLTAVSGTSLLTCQTRKLEDVSGNAATITKTGNVSVKSVNPFRNNSGDSLYFDGTGDYLKMPSDRSSSQDLVFGTGDFTIEAWAYGLSGAKSIFAISGMFGLIIYPGTTMSVVSSGGTTILTDTTAFVMDVWNHVAYTRTSGVIRLFVNGALVASGTNTADYATPGNAYVGMWLDGSTNLWKGYLKEVRVTRGYSRYTSAFTPPTTPHNVR